MLRRPTFYAVIALLVALIGLTYYLMSTLDSPQLREATKKARALKAASSSTNPTF